MMKTLELERVKMDLIRQAPLCFKTDMDINDWVCEALGVSPGLVIACMKQHFANHAEELGEEASKVNEFFGATYAAVVAKEIVPKRVLFFPSLCRNYCAKIKILC